MEKKVQIFSDICCGVKVKSTPHQLLLIQLSKFWLCKNDIIAALVCIQQICSNVTLLCQHVQLVKSLLGRFEAVLGEVISDDVPS